MKIEHYPERRIKKRVIFRDNQGKELFSVNLIKNKSVIFIAGREFMTCHFVPLAIPIKIFPKLKHIDSINDVIDNLDHSFERTPPKWIHGEKVGELDFFVNCSNLQVWVEHDFDTRLLDYRLSFPLLKALGKINIRARMRYREELIERYKASQNIDISGYLKERIEHSFSWEEKLDLLQPSEQEIVRELLKNYNCYEQDFSFDFKVGTISKLELFSNLQIRANGLPERLKDLKGINEFDIMDNNLFSLPEWLKELSTLKKLFIGDNPLKILPSWLPEMTTLENLNLINMSLNKLPENLGALINLQDLCLNYNELKGLPESFRKLKKLKVLNMVGCGLERLPEQVLFLHSLEELDLEQNNLSELPDLSVCLPNLKKITLTKNKFLAYPKNLSHHPSLKDIY